MNETEIIDIARDALWTLLKVVGPLLLIGMTVGLAISLFQTVTHIQEMTLTFIPKLVAVFTAMIILLPWMIGQMTQFTNRVMDKIVGLN